MTLVSFTADHKKCCHDNCLNETKNDVNFNLLFREYDF